MKLKRTKRDSATHIYQTCKAAGTCPDDVIKKVENDTIADRILKWVAGFLYFGGLGIGTAKGTGGARGYVPLSRGTGVSTGSAGGTRVLRPSGPVDVLGPTEGVVIDATPETPSVFRPAGGAGGSRVPTEEIELEVIEPTDHAVTVENPATDVPATSIPTLDVSSTFTEIKPTPPRISSTSQFNNAVFNSNLEPVAEIGGSSFVYDSRVAGSIVGATPEEIQLSTFATSQLEEVPLDAEVYTSTPKETVRPRKRPFYHRFFKQIPTTSTSFLQAPVGGEYTFENPAFESDLWPAQEQPIRTRNLTDVSLARAAGGRVRASRLGQEFGMVTRSGQQLGQFVHFYNDFSSIEAINSTSFIETSPLESTIVDSNAPTLENIIDSLQSLINQIETLRDTADSIELSTFAENIGVEEVSIDSDVFNNSRLRLLDVEVESELEHGTGQLISQNKFFGISSKTETHHNATSNSIVPTKIPFVPLEPGTSIIITYSYTASTVWDPSLYKKRKRAFLF